MTGQPSPRLLFWWHMPNPIDDAKIELIKATFAETGSLRAAARAAGCSVSTAQKYAGSRDAFEHVRTEKRRDIIEALGEARIKLIEALVEPESLKKASVHEKAVALGIVIDKHQLLSGEATERHEHRNTGEARELLARRFDELAERRRARGAAGESVGAGSA